MAFEDRWTALLDAATDTFAELGFAGASLGDIAARAGVNRALVYEHVSSKEELFRAAVARERERLAAYLASGYDTTAALGLRDRVRGRFHLLLDYGIDHPRSVQLLDLPAASDLVVEKGTGPASGDLASLLSAELGGEGPPTRSTQILAKMIVGMVNEVVVASKTADWDTEAVVDVLTDFTISGVLGLTPEVLARADQPGEPRQA